MSEIDGLGPQIQSVQFEKQKKRFGFRSNRLNVSIGGKDISIKVRTFHIPWRKKYYVCNFVSTLYKALYQAGIDLTDGNNVKQLMELWVKTFSISGSKKLMDLSIRAFNKFAQIFGHSKEGREVIEREKKRKHEFTDGYDGYAMGVSRIGHEMMARLHKIDDEMKKLYKLLATENPNNLEVDRLIEKTLIEIEDYKKAGELFANDLPEDSPRLLRRVIGKKQESMQRIINLSQELNKARARKESLVKNVKDAERQIKAFKKEFSLERLEGIISRKRIENHLDKQSDADLFEVYMPELSSNNYQALNGLLIKLDAEGDNELDLRGLLQIYHSIKSRASDGIERMEKEEAILCFQCNNEMEELGYHMTLPEVTKQILIERGIESHHKENETNVKETIDDYFGKMCVEMLEPIEKEIQSLKDELKLAASIKSKFVIKRKIAAKEREYQEKESYIHNQLTKYENSPDFIKEEATKLEKADREKRRIQVFEEMRQAQLEVKKGYDPKIEKITNKLLALERKVQELDDSRIAEVARLMKKKEQEQDELFSLIEKEESIIDERELLIESIFGAQKEIENARAYVGSLEMLKASVE